MVDTAELCRPCTSGTFRCDRCFASVCGRHYTVRGKAADIAPGGYQEWGEYAEFEVVLDHDEVVPVPLPHLADVRSLDAAALDAYTEAWRKPAAICIWCRQKLAKEAADRQTSLRQAELDRIARQRRAAQEAELHRRADDDRRRREEELAREAADQQLRQRVWPAHAAHMAAQSTPLGTLVEQRSRRMQEVWRLATIADHDRWRLDQLSEIPRLRWPDWLFFVSTAWLAVGIALRMVDGRDSLGRALVFSIATLVSTLVVVVVDTERRLRPRQEAASTDATPTIGEVSARPDEEQRDRERRSSARRLGFAVVLQVVLFLLLPGALGSGASWPQRLIAHGLPAMLSIAGALAYRRERRQMIGAHLAAIERASFTEDVQVSRADRQIRSARCPDAECPYCKDVVSPVSAP